MLEIALMTNFREGSEFVADFVFNSHFLSFIAGVIVMLAVLRKIYSFFQHHTRVLALLIIAGTLTGLFGAARAYRRLGTIPALPSSSALLRISDMAIRVYYSHKAYNAMLDSSPKDITITARMREIPNVVFVLGESTTRNHMQIYGYNLPTTPILSAQNDIHIFTDTISPHSYTNAVLKKMFTFCRYDSQSEWFTYATLFRILKEAGFHTLWLSNQEAQIGGNVVALYSRQCNTTKFTEAFTDKYENLTSYDGVLLPILDDAIRNENEHDKNFYFIHLMGTHGRYSMRYPLEYDKFTAEDEGGFDGISRSQKKIRAEYDNAILYNDFVVSEIIRRFEDKNAIVIYVSDHGEEVYDSMNFFSHNEGTPSRYMIEVPFIIWTSQKFRQAYPELEERIASSVDRPYMTDDMIHTVLDIMGIETPEYDPSKSIINPNFDSSRKRIYAGMLYDKERGLHEIQ